MRIVVTGGAGFVGSAVCRYLVADRGATVLNIDRLGPSSSLASLRAISSSPRYMFRRADIADRDHVAALLTAFAPDGVVHAASDWRASERCEGAEPSFNTDIMGTWRLLEAVREHWSRLPETRRARFRLVSASALDRHASPAAACRAASDEIVTGWHAAFGLPTIVSRAAEMFGCCQFPTAPVPAAIIAAMQDEKPTPVATPAGRWLHVEDHARAIGLMLDQGRPGASYAVAGQGLADAEAVRRRIEVLVERHTGRRQSGQTGATLAGPKPAAAQGTLSPRDAEASTALAQDTGWRPEETLESALSKTVRWYIANEAWWRPLSAAAATPDAYGVLRIA